MSATKDVQTCARARLAVDRADAELIAGFDFRRSAAAARRFGDPGGCQDRWRALLSRRDAQHRLRESRGGVLQMEPGMSRWAG